VLDSTAVIDSRQRPDRGSRQTALAEMARAIEAEPVPGSRVEQERSMLESLYPATDAHALWTEHQRLSPQARELLDILASSESYGLRPSDYLADALRAAALELSTNSRANDWQQVDVRLSRAAIRLISHLHFGRIDPRIAGSSCREAMTRSMLLPKCWRLHPCRRWSTP